MNVSFTTAVFFRGKRAKTRKEHGWEEIMGESIEKNVEDIRLNKYLSEAGVCSRREADRLIEAGKVLVDGEPARTGQRIRPGQRVQVGDTILGGEKEEQILLAVYKPPGVICTTDKREKRNIVDYVGYPSRIYPIGRLDKDSEGLILLTNDGDLINAMMRGANRHEKEYIVKIDREITPDFLEIMRKGIYLKDLDITTRECKIEKIGKYTFQIILTQGVNRQIRRMCEACGAKVRSLKRIRVMNIRLGDLKPGEWRKVTGEELETLLTDTGMSNRK